VIHIVEQPATPQTLVQASDQKVVCEFCDQPATENYAGKNLCEECRQEVDDFIDRKIDEAKMDEFIYEPCFEEY